MTLQSVHLGNHCLCYKNGLFVVHYTRTSHNTFLVFREFDLPWFSVRSRSTVTKTPRKRKKLKGRLFHRNT